MAERRESSDAERVSQIVSAGSGVRDIVRQVNIAKIVYDSHTGMDLIPNRYEVGPVFGPVNVCGSKNDRRKNGELYQIDVA